MRAELVGVVVNDDACSDEYEEVDRIAAVVVELVNKYDKSVEEEAACEVDDALVSVELRSLMVVLKYPEYEYEFELDVEVDVSIAVSCVPKSEEDEVNSVD